MLQRVTRKPYNLSFLTRRKTSLSALNKPIIKLKPDSGRFQVAVLNGDTNTGRYTCLALRRSPLIKNLRIHVSSKQDEFIKDLTFVPGISSINVFSGTTELERTLKDADIVLVLPKYEYDSNVSKEEIFLKNEKYLREVASACVDQCPSAVVAIDVAPINVSVPLFTNILSQLNALDSNKVLGVMNIHCLRSQSFLSRKFGLDPNSLRDILVIGGGTSETMVPVLSKFQPGGFPIVAWDVLFRMCLHSPEGLLNLFRAHFQEDIATTIEELRMLEWAESELYGIREAAFLRSRSLAIVTSQIASGLMGVRTKGCAFIRTCDPVAVKYFSVPVEFGPSGIEKNLGLPKLSDVEMEILDLSMGPITKEIEFGESLVPSEIPLPARQEFYPVKEVTHASIPCNPCPSLQ